MTWLDERSVDVLIVGGGQAGLAMAYHLKRRVHRVLVLEADERLGQQWRSRWDSLSLFTPARYAHLPGMPLSLPAWSYPTKNDIADYLERYADVYGLPVRCGVEVQHVHQQDGEFIVRTTAGIWRARNVVVATGPFQNPAIPSMSAGFTAEVIQLHSSDYRRPNQLPQGSTLVVGGGNSGYQIAMELVLNGNHEVHLSRGERNVSVPQRLLGRDIFWWQKKLGILDVPATSRLGHYMRQHDRPVIGITAEQLIRAGVRVHGRMHEAAGTTAHFVDRSEIEVSSVVWATGFRTDYSWIHVPEALDEQGTPIHARGVTPVAGLYFFGLAWLHTTGSALLGFVGRDAAYLADRIAQRQQEFSG